MGVAGLRTFLENFSVFACSHNKNIRRMVQEYEKKTGKKAKIVVDAQSCYQLWYADTHWLTRQTDTNWVTGYDVRHHVARLRLFVEKFSELNVELIFVFGGLHYSANERRRWLAECRQSIVDVHSAIDSLSIFDRPPDDFQPLIPSPGLTTMYILKYMLGCKVFVAVNNCREEVIKYAQEYECLAIIGQDTDYVVSQTNARFVLTTNKFSIHRMETIAYDRVELAKQLEIAVKELPLLAILAGNNLIPVDEIKEFHRRIYPRTIDGEVPVLMFMGRIASYIRNLPKKVPIERTLTRLAVDLFNDQSRVELLKTSYYSYFVVKNSDTSTNAAPAASTSEWSKILRTARDRCRNALLPCLAYSVLREQIFEGGTAFEDLRIYHSDSELASNQPSSTILRPLRSRLYGILLSEKETQDASAHEAFVLVQGVVVQEWCNENVNSYLEPVAVKPTEPEAYHPGLLALWSDDKGSINEDRWTLFLTTISSSLKAKSADWRSLDDKVLFTLLAVYYLYDVEYLTDNELVAVLLTIATDPLDGAQFCQPYRKLCFRAANITITLNRAFQLVLTILATCGYPKSLTEHNTRMEFDGKKFQINYIGVVRRKMTNIKSLCKNNDSHVTTFYRYKELITKTKKGDLSATSNFVRKLGSLLRLY